MSKSSISYEIKELVSVFLTSGQSQKGFSEAHGLTKGKLHYWVKKFSESPIQDQKTLLLLYDILACNLLMAQYLTPIHKGLALSK